MAHTSESRHLSVSINRDFDTSYDFLCLPENFPKWASGLAGALRRLGNDWVTHTAKGPLKVRFSERNSLGVLDHWVFPQAGLEIYVPLRLVVNGTGCELILTLFRQPDMSDEQYAADAEWVMRDLASAKRLLES